MQNHTIELMTNDELNKYWIKISEETEKAMMEIEKRVREGRMDIKDVGE